MHLDRAPLLLEPSLTLSDAPISDTGMNDAVCGGFNSGGKSFLRQA
uniref:Uncharacterized protein n=1 Tax=Rhizobium leguminosarum bv. viciae TaxID=387 RepID=A0A0U3J8Z9_RHILV|nr:hypothetical protein [Rhizobium leguminosarum bv. viciae]